jgi:hypothetical protein
MPLVGYLLPEAALMFFVVLLTACPALVDEYSAINQPLNKN